MSSLNRVVYGGIWLDMVLCTGGFTVGMNLGLMMKKKPSSDSPPSTSNPPNSLHNPPTEQTGLMETVLVTRGPFSN